MSVKFQQAIRISVLSTTYVLCRVSATENGVASNPTTGTVQFAFVPESQDNASPASSAWVAGSWETGADGYWARCLVGPSGVATLTTGNYDVWVQVTKAPETVIDRVGVLSIY